MSVSINFYSTYKWKKSNKQTSKTYYFFNDMINIKDFDSSLLKLDKSRLKRLLFITLDTLQKNMNIRLIV